MAAGDLFRGAETTADQNMLWWQDTYQAMDRLSIGRQPSALRRTGRRTLFAIQLNVQTSVYAIDTLVQRYQRYEVERIKVEHGLRFDRRRRTALTLLWAALERLQPRALQQFFYNVRAAGSGQ